MINLACPKFEKTRKKKPSRKKFWMVMGILLLTFLGAGIGGYFLLSREEGFSGQAVKIKIEAPSEVVSGSSYEYLIEYSNEEDINLQDAELIVYFPPGFNLIDSLPSPEEREELTEVNVARKIRGESSSRTWKLDVLKAKDEDAIKFKGIFLGDPGASHSLRVVLSYQPENFSSRFSSEEQTDIKIKEALVDFSLEVPEKVGKDKEFDLTVRYKNVTSEDLENVRIVLTYPENFTLLSTEPRADQRDRIWDFRILRRGERGRIDIRGKLTVADPPPLFGAEFGIIDQYKQFLSQVKSIEEVSVIDPALEITTTANSKEEIDLNPSQELDFIITYDNVGKVSVENVKIVFSLETELIDTSSISVQGGHYDDNEFVWDPNSSSTLSEIKPGEHGNVRFKAKLLPVFPYSTEDRKNLSLSGKAYLESNKIAGLEGFEYKALSNEFIAHINTELTVTQEARYHNFDYEQVGSGPLPPKVGQKTTYRIYWTVTNTTNDAGEIQIDTTLPQGVSWEDNAFSSLGSSIRYEEEKRKVVWELGRLQAFSGSILPGAQGWFVIGITPQAQDIGQVLLLTEKTIITGRDLFTDTELSGEYPSLDTDLENDWGALGKGEVVK